MDPQRLDPVGDRELVLEVDGAAGEVAGERGGWDRIVKRVRATEYSGRGELTAYDVRQ